MSKHRRARDEKRDEQFDSEHQRSGQFVKANRHLMRVPGNGGRQRLGLVMITQRGETSPGAITAAQFYHSGRENQPEQQPPQQPKNDRGWRGNRWKPRKDFQRRQKDRQKTGLEQQHVPLVSEKS